MTEVTASLPTFPSTSRPSPRKTIAASQWRPPVGLIALRLIPVLAGAVRLNEQVEIYSAYKHELEARGAEAQAANELAGVLLLESGIRHSATDIEWATWCKAEINRRLSPEKDRS